MPFKLLRPMEIKKVSERHKWVKMKLLMTGVQLAAERCDMWRPQRGTSDVGSAVRLYEAVRPYFTYPSKILARRDNHISWYTVYNVYVKHDKNLTWICPRWLGSGCLGMARSARLGMARDVGMARSAQDSSARLGEPTKFNGEQAQLGCLVRSCGVRPTMSSAG